MSTTPRGRSDGQILVLFALAIVAMIALVGLVIDGGSTFAQRRGQQNAADLAALAGADALINGLDATTAAERVTKANGYEKGKNDVAVTVTVVASAGTVKVDIGAPHKNYFAGIVGLPTWQVGVTATALGWARPDTATGALPVLFSKDVFDNGVAKPEYGDPGVPFTWEHGTSDEGDAPADAEHVAWTNFQLKENVDTSRVSAIIDGSLVVSVTAKFDDYLGQHNNGQHAALFGDIGDILPSDGSGRDFVVPITGPPGTGTTCNDGTHSDGCFLGWATIRIISTSQGGKSITGYFTREFRRELTYSGGCDSTTCPKNVGGYTLRLIN